MHAGAFTKALGSSFGFHWLGACCHYLPNAKRSVTFLLLFIGAGLVLVQPCAGGSGVFEPTGSLVTGRAYHTSILLPNGKVFAEGSSNTTPQSPELYDIASGTWADTGVAGAGYWFEGVTLLSSGKVLVTGGLIFLGDMGVSFAGSELYDPVAGTWITTGGLNAARRAHTATLLPNGKVLVAGGWGEASPLVSAELYDPASGSWMATGNLNAPRSSHKATLLPSGKVLVVGGAAGSSGGASAELYDPANGTWTPTGSLATGRSSTTATLLPSGKVLVAGGYSGGSLASAELYDPASETWTVTGSLGDARYSHTATLLPNGKVLVTGGLKIGSGGGGVRLASAELYDPATGLWMATGSLGAAREIHTATLLPNGRVLVAGGYSTSPGAQASAELYLGPPMPAPINISGSIFYCSSSSPVQVPNVTLHLTGSGAEATLSDGSGNYQFSSLVSNATYIVMPTKNALLPASHGIDTVDAMAIQRHFLNIAPLPPGCRVTAADVNRDTVIDTVDVIAIQRFYLGLSTGIASTGKYQFTPASRSYPGILSDQTGQNYDTLIFGDVTSPFAE